GPVGALLRKRQAVIVTDVLAPGRFLPPFVRDDGRARALMSLPLVAGDLVVGTLILTSRTPGRFGRRHARLLQPVVQALTIAIQHSRLLRATAAGVQDRSRLQSRLDRAERYAAIGRLAGVLAHEIRNPLTVIGTTIQYLRDRQLVGEEYIPLLEAAEQKVRDVDESLESLLRLSRPLELRLEPGPLEPLLVEVAEVIRARPAERAVDVSVETEPGPARTLHDRRFLGQALLNLALNALDAMPSGGRLTFAARPAPESGELVITVSDTGGGIESGELEAIFEPYYTTKIHGTGLGLAITRRIVEEHGGSIQAASEHGRGTTFTLLLPA